MANPYESGKLLEEYLLLHYGRGDEVLPYAFGPHQALDFPARCVRECLDPGALPTGARALDLGCSVGRSSFELARWCERVVGIDYSRSFIAAAQRLRDQGALEHPVHEEGELHRITLFGLPEGVDPARVEFEVGDATDLRTDLGAFDVVLLANLLCRLPDPAALLTRLPALTCAGAQVIITSPYTWMEEHTPRERWLGGLLRDGVPVRTIDSLKAHLEPLFRLEQLTDLPFLIREHSRKFQWSVAQASCWRRVA